MRLNERCRSDKTQTFECDQVFVRGSRWISQRRPVTSNGREHSLGVGIEQIGDEHVGMLRGEAVGSQTVSREIPQVPGHNHVRPTLNCRGQHMDVVGVRQIESGGVCQVSGHNGIGKVPVHRRARSFQHVRREIGPVRHNAPYGMPVFGDRFMLTPGLGAGLSDAGRDYRLGRRLGLARPRRVSLELGLEGTRREAANDDAEHGVGLRLTSRW